MIKLFISDIDGCLSTPFESPDWELLAQIKAFNQQSSQDPVIPPLTICTGRPMPYAEAVAQWLNIERPIVFESAGIFHPATYGITVNGAFTNEAEQEIKDLKKWLKEEIIPDYEGMAAEFTKFMDAGLIHPRKEVILKVLPRIQGHVSNHHSDFEVHHTEVSINILLKGNNKKTGIKTLCELEEVKPEEVAYIGDSSGDIPALKYVGRPFAPQNATDPVKKHAEVVPYFVTRGVLEAYRRIIAENKNS